MPPQGAERASSAAPAAHVRYSLDEHERSELPWARIDSGGTPPPALPHSPWEGAAGTLPTPLTNAAERGTIEIEKESLPVRRLAQVMQLLYEKVADSLDGGGYFFVS